MAGMIRGGDGSHFAFYLQCRDHFFLSTQIKSISKPTPLPLSAISELAGYLSDEYGIKPRSVP
jgi:hypothetical protein